MVAWRRRARRAWMGRRMPRTASVTIAATVAISRASAQGAVGKGARGWRCGTEVEGGKVASGARQNGEQMLVGWRSHR